MQLIPFFNRLGRIQVWADPISCWLSDIDGVVFALAWFDGVYWRTGTQMGWWFGDHMRDCYGRVTLARAGAKIEGVDMPHVRKLPKPPKLLRPSSRPVLNRLFSMAPTKKHEWTNFEPPLSRLKRVAALLKDIIDK